MEHKSKSYSVSPPSKGGLGGFCFIYSIITMFYYTSEVFLNNSGIYAGVNQATFPWALAQNLFKSIL